MPKYKPIVESVIADIERGVLRRNDLLPSMSENAGGGKHRPYFILLISHPASSRHPSP